MKRIGFVVIGTFLAGICSSFPAMAMEKETYRLTVISDQAVPLAMNVSQTGGAGFIPAFIAAIVILSGITYYGYRCLRMRSRLLELHSILHEEPVYMGWNLGRLTLIVKNKEAESVDIKAWHREE